MKATLFLLSILAALTACSTTAIRNQAYWNETQGQSLEMKVVKVSQKRTVADITVILENHYPFAVVIPANSLHYDRNGERATGDSNLHIVLRPGEAFKTDEMRLNYQTHGYSGDAVLALEYIYQGEEAMGSTSSSVSEGSGHAVAYRGVAVGENKIETKTKGFITKTFVEGKQLKPIIIPIPENK